jgi:hypothetical protein
MNQHFNDDPFFSNDSLKLAPSRRQVMAVLRKIATLEQTKAKNQGLTGYVLHQSAISNHPIFIEAFSRNLNLTQDLIKGQEVRLFVEAATREGLAAVVMWAGKDLSYAKVYT